MVRQLAPLAAIRWLSRVGRPDRGFRTSTRGSSRTLSGLLPQNWRKPENQVLKPWARGVITTWVLIVVPLLIATLVLIVVTFSSVGGHGLGCRAVSNTASWWRRPAAGEGAAVAARSDTRLRRSRCQSSEWRTFSSERSARSRHGSGVAPKAGRAHGRSPGW